VNVIKQNIFHSFVRWGLGIHGAIHLAETAANIYEKAWISAGLSALAGFLMIAGACIDLSHHRGSDHESR
tara:strand:- start:210 stop:419 length:210 start_codon:yes stop_codon:yes gene_type:complete